MKKFIKVLFKLNGQIKVKGVLIKDEDRGTFYLITNDWRNINRDPVYLSNFHDVMERNPDARLFTLASNAGHDSFVTILLKLTNSPDYEVASTFSGYEGFLLGTVNQLDELGNIDEMFASDNITTTSLSAVTSSGDIVIKPEYSRTYEYTGYASAYHGHTLRNRFNVPVNTDKPWRIGIELELFARSRDCYNKIVNARTNWFQCEHDGSLHGDYPIEMKTIPLRSCDATDINFWTAPITKLKELATSKSNNTSGLHIHIGKEILGNTQDERNKTLSKLTWFYAYCIEDIPDNNAKHIKINGRSIAYGEYRAGYAKTELSEFAKTIGWDNVCRNVNGFYQMSNTVRAKMGNMRGEVNMLPLDSYGTIEFRKPKGIISQTRIVALVTWYEQMCLYCRENEPQNLSFEGFFSRVMTNPCVAHFFQEDDEC